MRTPVIAPLIAVCPGGVDRLVRVQAARAPRLPHQSTGISYEVTFTRANARQATSPLAPRWSCTVGGTAARSFCRFPRGRLAPTRSPISRATSPASRRKGGQLSAGMTHSDTCWVHFRPAPACSSGSEIPSVWFVVSDRQSRQCERTWSRRFPALSAGRADFSLSREGFDFPAASGIGTETGWKIAADSASAGRAGSRRYRTTHDLVDIRFLPWGDSVIWTRADISGTWIAICHYPSGSVTGRPRHSRSGRSQAAHPSGSKECSARCRGRLARAGDL